MTDLRVRAGAGEPPTLLLLHGLGATGDVWAGLTGLLGAAAWVAPDLPGHGGSAALPAYSFGSVAEAVAGLVDPRGTVVVGHSFGGVIGLHLAGRPGVRAVVGLGIKVHWTAEELARAAALAGRAAPVFATRDEAVRRHLRVAGLDGLVDPADPALSAAVVQDEAGGWRPALDPRAFGVGEPGMGALLAAAPVPVVLARGGTTTWSARRSWRRWCRSRSSCPGWGTTRTSRTRPRCCRSSAGTAEAGEPAGTAPAAVRGRHSGGPGRGPCPSGVCGPRGGDSHDRQQRCAGAPG